MSVQKHGCNICGRSFDTGHGLRMHQVQTHPEETHEIVECRICKEEFSAPKSDERSFCSRECVDAYNKSRRNRIEKECDNCGDLFETPPSQDKRFCSRECYVNSHYDPENEPREKIVELYEDNSARDVYEQVDVGRERVIEILKEEGVYRERPSTLLRRIGRQRAD